MWRAGKFAMTKQADQGFFQHLVEHVLDVITVMAADGRFVYNSPSIRTVLGHRPEDLEDSHVLSYIHEDDSANVSDTIDGILAGKESAEVLNFRFRHMDGTHRHCQAVARRWKIGSEVGLLVNTRDVTNQHQTLTDLATSNELLTQIYSASSNLLTVSKPKEGTILDANDAWLKTLGYERNEVIGRTALELGIWGLPENRQRLINELDQHGELNGYRATSYTKDGQPLKLIVDARLLKVAGELRVLMSAQNITEILQTEEQLRQAQKIESLGQLTGGVAHDFNNLLGIIMGNIELLREGLEPGSEQHAFADQVLNAAESGASLTRQLLAFSRRQTLSPLVLNLADRLTGIEDLINTSVGENTVVRITSGANTWPCLLDPTQFENAVLNLTINAKDAMPVGGTLEYRLSNELVTKTSHPRVLGGNTSGDYVCLRVSDTGSGMSDEVVNQAFDPFFTTKKFGKGTGLGLSMVFGFVKQSGGMVGIESQPGAGTTISLYFPRSDDTKILETEQEKVLATPRIERGRALVLEDNQPLCRLITRYLDELGYSVLTASGESDLNSVQTELGSIDLIVSDVLLEGPKRGPELVRELRQAHPACLVLFMTGYAATEVIAETDLSISKPFGRVQFLNAIASLVHR
jgi:PAS domain S-box-containing protein